MVARAVGSHDRRTGGGVQTAFTKTDEKGEERGRGCGGSLELITVAAKE